MKRYNVRHEADRRHLEAQGFRWAAAVCRGDNIGRVVSKHRTYEAANRAARNRDLDIVDLMQHAI